MSALLQLARPVDFDRLYRRHAASVYRYAFAVLGNHADAEDVTQQTFLNAYRAIEQGTKPRKAENWLLRIAHNEVRRHFRSAQARPHEVELDERLPHNVPETSEPTLADVLRALQHLTPIQRSALVMREFEGRSYAEIAELLNLTQSALEGQIFRARRALAEHLEGAFTCAEAEDALLRRLDGRLPRRIARRLKAHLQECHGCVRFADIQKRQRALLKGLSVMPIPASLFLYRPEQAAAAGVGASAVAAGGSAAVGGGAAAGGTGIAAGVVAKAAAVAAAAAVTGGVGYGVATGPDKAVRADLKVAHAAVAAPRRSRSAADAVGTRAVGTQRRPARLAIGHTPRRPEKAKAPARAESSAKSSKAAVRLGHTRKKTPFIEKARPTTHAGTKLKSKAPRDRARPAKGKKTGRERPARAKPAQPSPRADKPKTPASGKPPAPPKAAAHPQPKGSSPVLPGESSRKLGR